MVCIIDIPVDGLVRRFFLLNHSDFQRIEVEGVVILDVWKIHNHRYVLEGFFYARKHIVSRCDFSSKKELFGAMQKLLQEFL